MIFSSCSKENEVNDIVTNEVPGEIKVDYIVDAGTYINGLIVNDNIAYVSGQYNVSNKVTLKLNKIDPLGNVTTLKEFADGEIFTEELTNNKAGEVLGISSSPAYGNKIYHFEKNYSEINPFYTMKPVSSTFAKLINLKAICNDGKDSYFVFDSSTLSMKRVVPDLNTDILIAGSEKKEI